MAIITRADLHQYRRTKIIATVGPASSELDVVSRLIEAGVNIFRLNMSHGEHEGHVLAYNNIRKAAEQQKLPIGILADLCGPKIRTGKFKGDGIDLQTGSEVTITMQDVLGEPGLISSQYADLARDVTLGDRILLADGLLELEVINVRSDQVQCRVIQGGHLGNHKGINLPGVDVSAPSMTKKDFTDAKFALDLGVDFIALSFVRKAEDLAPLRRLITEQNRSTLVISKMEKPEALLNAESILEVTDAIMVARGDLGVELPAEEVPVAQAELIRLARKYGKPVIVATQMLESMIVNARPTRAEVTDVAHAVTSGTDAIMLSGETAVGEFPVETVSTMDRIARQTEAHLWQDGHYGHSQIDSKLPMPIWNVIANATAQISKELHASAILVISSSGISAATVSIARPPAPIVGITADDNVARRMTLFWGVIPLCDDSAGKINPNQLARDIATELGLTKEGGYVLLVRGFHGERKLNSPSVTVIAL